jgi:hypothetical protein
MQNYPLTACQASYRYLINSLLNLLINSIRNLHTILETPKIKINSLVCLYTLGKKQSLIMKTASVDNRG